MITKYERLEDTHKLQKGVSRAGQKGASQ